MDRTELIETIDFAKRDFSLVLVNPKESLLEWLQLFWKRKGLDRFRNDIPEENSVLVIPSIERFSQQGDLENFLDGIKPNLLFIELRRYHVSPDEFARPFTKEVFDDCFDIALRNSASIIFLSDFREM